MAETPQVGEDLTRVARTAARLATRRHDIGTDASIGNTSIGAVGTHITGSAAACDVGV